MSPLPFANAGVIHYACAELPEPRGNCAETTGVEAHGGACRRAPCSVDARLVAG